MENHELIIGGMNRLSQEEAGREIRACASLQERYGLSLSEEDITVLTARRAESLERAGRVEFGGGILPKLIYAFCDSPFIQRGEWCDTLCELQEAFYCFLSESYDAYTDDELIGIMATVFNGEAQGSTDYLIGTSLSEMIRVARCGEDAPDGEERDDENLDEEERERKYRDKEHRDETEKGYEI